MKQQGKWLLPETLPELHDLWQLSQQTEGKGKHKHPTDEAKEALESFNAYMISIPSIPRKLLMDLVDGTCPL